MRSTAWSSRRRASARSERASWRMSRRAPGSGLARVHFAALRNRANASFTNLRACRTSGWSSTIKSSVCSRSCGRTRAGCPSRTACSPWASSRSRRLSTARLLGAQTSTLSPRRTAWRISSTSVVVLPVPGGPWTAATSDADRAKRTASRCDGFSVSSRGVKSDMNANAGAASPSRTRRSSARRSPFAAAARSSACRWRSRAVSSSARSTRKTASSSASRGSLRATRSCDSSRSQTTPRRPESRARPWSESSTGEPTCNRVHGSGTPPRLPSATRTRPPRPADSSRTTRSSRQSPPRSASAAREPADALQRLAGLRFRLQLQQGGQPPKMVVRWDHERKEDSPQWHCV